MGVCSTWHTGPCSVQRCQGATRLLHNIQTFFSIFHISFIYSLTSSAWNIMRYYNRQLGPFTYYHLCFERLFSIFTPIISISWPQSDIFFSDSVVSPTHFFHPLFTRGNVFICKGWGLGVEEKGRGGAYEGTEQDSQRKKRVWDCSHLWVWLWAKPLPTGPRHMSNCLFLQ